MTTPQFYTVPKGTQPAECKSSGCRKAVFFIVTQRGSRMPVDCDVEGGQEPTEEGDGWGVSHFTTCADPNRFSKHTRGRHG